MTRWQLGSGWLAPGIQTVVQTKRWHWLVLLLWMVPLLLVGFFDLDHQSLMAHDEGLYARRARVIVDTGDWIHPWSTPHHKTPGPYWVVALFIQMFGRHEVAVRLPSVLASIGCIWLTYAIGRRLLGSTAALLGTLSLGVTPLWLQYSRLATPDILFTELILLAVWLLLASDSTKQDSPSSHWLRFGAGIALGLTILVRSALAMLPLACLLPYFLLSGRHHLQRWRFYLGGLIGLLPTVIWLWLCWQRYDMAIIHSLINFPVNQSFTAERAKSPLFYLLNLLTNDFLWVFFALGAVILLLVRLVRSKAELAYHPQISLLLLYPVLYLGLLSFASTKLPHYAIPAYPFLALLAGYAMEQLVQTTGNINVKRLLSSINGLLMVLGSVLIVAACLTWLTERLPHTNDIRPYAPIALSLGLAWLVTGLVWFRSQLHRSRLISWVVLLLLSHWFSLTLAWGSSDLGNINPDMKALLIRDDIQPILATEAISFSPGLDSKRSTLLRFYTPYLGQKLRSLDTVQPDDYLWIEENELPILHQSYDSLGLIKTTHLIHVRSQ